MPDELQNLLDSQDPGGLKGNFLIILGYITRVQFDRGCRQSKIWNPGPNPGKSGLNQTKHFLHSKLDLSKKMFYVSPDKNI